LPGTTYVSSRFPYLTELSSPSLNEILMLEHVRSSD